MNKLDNDHAIHAIDVLDLLDNVIAKLSANQANASSRSGTCSVKQPSNAVLRVREILRQFKRVTDAAPAQDRSIVLDGCYNWLARRLHQERRGVEDLLAFLESRTQGINLDESEDDYEGG